jgi:hypothetical protein
MCTASGTRGHLRGSPCVSFDELEVFWKSSWNVHVSLIKITHDTFISATLRSPTDIRAERQWFVRCRGPAGQKEHLLVHVLLNLYSATCTFTPTSRSNSPTASQGVPPIGRVACSVTNLSLSTVINHVWLSLGRVWVTIILGLIQWAYLKRAAPAAVQHQRATPDRPSTGAAIAWTEVWPTQPLQLYTCTQSVKVKNYQHSAIARPASLSWSTT